MSERQGRRGGGRAGRQAAREASRVIAAPVLDRRLPPVEIIDEAGLVQIEENAETILSEVGIAFQDYPDALDLWRDAGADVSGELVRFPRGMCRQIVTENAPATYIQHARNPDRSVSIGGNTTVFAPNYGSPFVSDLDQGRRYATLADFENVVKLAYLLPHLHHSGGTVCEPVDVPVDVRHLDMVYAHLRYSDKPFMGSVTSAERAADSVDLGRIAFGGDLADRTVMTSLINASSPMRWDATMLGRGHGVRPGQPGQRDQPVHPGRGHVAGDGGRAGRPSPGRGPVGHGLHATGAARLAVIFGTFASSMSMATGAPTFGTPEAGQAIFVMAALARRCGVPFRSGGQLTASKAPDAQAAYESAHTLLPTVQAGVNFVLHAAGWLEGGLTLGYEKLILDADQLGAMEGPRPGGGLERQRASHGGVSHQRPRQPLPGHRPHPGQLRVRLLALGGGRQQQLRAVVGGGVAHLRPAGQRPLEGTAGRLRAAPPRRRHRRRTARLHHPPQSRARQRARLSRCPKA